MRKTALVLALPLFFTPVLGFDVAKLNAKKAVPYEQKTQEFRLPVGIDENGVIDEAKLGDSPYAKTVIYGAKLVNETTRYLGPQAKDEKMRFAGNNLSCSSCHTSGGVVPDQSPFVGIYARFPQYVARSDQLVTLQDRINGCFQPRWRAKRSLRTPKRCAR